MLSQEKLIEVLKNKLDKNNETWKLWIDRLERKDQFFSMEWSRPMFAVAAEIYVFKKELEILEYERGEDINWDYQFYISSLQDEIIKSAARVPNSNSETSLIMELEKNAARAKIYEIYRKGF